MIHKSDYAPQSPFRALFIAEAQKYVDKPDPTASADDADMDTFRDLLRHGLVVTGATHYTTARRMDSGTRHLRRLLSYDVVESKDIPAYYQRKLCILFLLQVAAFEACPDCGGMLSPRAVTHDYAEYGRTEACVTLHNVSVATCECGEEYITIPKIEQLHKMLKEIIDQYKSLCMILDIEATWSTLDAKWVAAKVVMRYGAQTIR